METIVKEDYKKELVKKNLGLIEDLICRLGKQDIDEYSKFRLLEAIEDVRELTNIKEN